MRYLFLLERHKDCLDRAQRYSFKQLIHNIFMSFNFSSISPEKLYYLKQYHLWTLGRASLDFLHAVNTLPPGFLWSSKLKPWFVSLVGTTSSLVGLYLIFYKRWLK